ncbi:XRE family transcriptional regulator [Pseudomonas sp. RIT412]|nr:XRE family transcriptional regulator [Pseudomonas sp. RIT 409]RAU55388.1 XRE family transcriptional regulator [Pseudomonas sp. RIT 412]
MNTFGIRLRQERKRLGLTQLQMAKLGGVEPNAQGHYESGARSPKASYLQRLSDAGVNVGYLFSDNPPDHSDGIVTTTLPGRLGGGPAGAAAALISQFGLNIVTTAQIVYDAARSCSRAVPSVDEEELEKQLSSLKFTTARFVESALVLIPRCVCVDHRTSSCTTSPARTETSPPKESTDPGA